MSVVQIPGTPGSGGCDREGAATATIDFRVYYEDTDASGVVYHVSYLRFLERGRSEWLRALGFSQQALRREFGVVFTVAELGLRYFKPARLDDVLTVTTAVAASRRASLVFRQEARRDDELIVAASVRVACVGAGDFRPCALPAPLLQASRPGDHGRIG
jgi:tol-pal system-associated acyl-CoA thioesterase